MYYSSILIPINFTIMKVLKVLWSTWKGVLMFSHVSCFRSIFKVHRCKMVKKKKKNKFNWSGRSEDLSWSGRSNLIRLRCGYWSLYQNSQHHGFVSRQPAHVSGGNSRRAACLDSCFATARAIVRGRSSHSPIRRPKDTRTERLNITSCALPRFRVMRCLMLQDAFGTDSFDYLILVGCFTFNNRTHLESKAMWQ